MTVKATHHSGPWQKLNDGADRAAFSSYLDSSFFTAYAAMAAFGMAPLRRHGSRRITQKQDDRISGLCRIERKRGDAKQR